MLYEKVTAKIGDNVTSATGQAGSTCTPPTPYAGNYYMPAGAAIVTGYVAATASTTTGAPNAFTFASPLPQHGAVTWSTPETIIQEVIGGITWYKKKYTYIPYVYYVGDDPFYFTVSSTGGANNTTYVSAAAPMSITSQYVNHSPVANPGSFTTLRNTKISGSLTAVDTDVKVSGAKDQDTLKYFIL